MDIRISWAGKPIPTVIKRTRANIALLKWARKIWRILGLTRTTQSLWPNLFSGLKNMRWTIRSGRTLNRPWKCKISFWEGGVSPRWRWSIWRRRMVGTAVSHSLNSHIQIEMPCYNHKKLGNSFKEFWKSRGKVIWLIRLQDIRVEISNRMKSIESIGRFTAVWETCRLRLRVRSIVFPPDRSKPHNQTQWPRTLRGKWYMISKGSWWKVPIYSMQGLNGRERPPALRQGRVRRRSNLLRSILILEWILIRGWRRIVGFGRKHSSQDSGGISCRIGICWFISFRKVRWMDLRREGRPPRQCQITTTWARMTPRRIGPKRINRSRFMIKCPLFWRRASPWRTLKSFPWTTWIMICRCLIFICRLPTIRRRRRRVCGRTVPRRNWLAISRKRRWRSKAIKRKWWCNSRSMKKMRGKCRGIGYPWIELTPKTISKCSKRRTDPN